MTNKSSSRASRLDRLEFAGFRLAYRLFRRLPRQRALRGGAAMGSLAYHLLGARKEVARLNLGIALPERTEREREAILLRSFRNLGRCAAEFCHLEKLTPDTVERYVRIEDPSVWRKLIETARERGVIVVTGHFGNWEMFAYAHGLLGFPITLVHRPMRNPSVDAVIADVRARGGTHSIAKKTAAKSLVRTLRDKSIVAIPTDQNQTRRFGVFVDFFGKTASTTPGPARLAMLTGAAVFPAFLVREEDTERHRIVVLPEIEMVKTGNREEDIVTNTQACTAALEEMIRKHPDHWLWLHKRWRTQPVGAPEVYPKRRR